MTLDDYVAWVAVIGRRAGVPDDHRVLEDGLGFASEIGEVAGVLTRWLRDGELRCDRLADELGDVAYYWARLSLVAGVAASTLLARSRAHIEWRRAGRPAGGPEPETGSIALDAYTAWALGPGTPVGSPDPPALCDLGLALVGDAGEVVECLRRLGREERQRQRLAGELGDVWHYWTRLSAVTGVAPGELLRHSRAKIEARVSLAASPPPRRP